MNNTTEYNDLLISNSVQQKALFQVKQAFNKGVGRPYYPGTELEAEEQRFENTHCEIDKMLNELIDDPSPDFQTILKLVSVVCQYSDSTILL